MKKTILKLIPCFALSVLMVACLSACGGTATPSSSSSASSSSSSSATASSSSSSSDEAASDPLDGTTWTAEFGETYGAATQGDEDEDELTSLTLHFDNGSAYNVVGDISFNYVVNEDGSIDVSNLNLGETHIDEDTFVLTYESETLMLQARINGGNATVTFDQD